MGQLFGYSSDWGCDNWHLVLMAMDATFSEVTKTVGHH